MIKDDWRNAQDDDLTIKPWIHFWSHERNRRNRWIVNVTEEQFPDNGDVKIDDTSIGGAHSLEHESECEGATSGYSEADESTQMNEDQVDMDAEDNDTRNDTDIPSPTTGLAEA